MYPTIPLHSFLLLYYFWDTVTMNTNLIFVLIISPCYYSKHTFEQNQGRSD